MNFGSFEGKTYFDLNGNEDYQRWINSGGTLPFPDGESRAEFITRCKAGLLDCLMELEKQVTVPEKVVCIVHGGMIMALFDSYGQGSYFDYQCRCGQGYECTLSYAVDANGMVKETSISMRDEKLILESKDMYYHMIAFLAGFLLDLLIGDPHWLYHPVRLIGNLIAALDHRLLDVTGIRNEKKNGAQVFC